MAKTNTNISGQDWHIFRRTCDRLRALYSWNELSKALGHSERGFAQAAYDTKHVCNTATVRKTLDLLAYHIEEGDLGTKEKDTTTETPMTPLSKDAKTYVAACDEMLTVYLVDWVEIKEAQGSDSLYQAYWNLNERNYTDIRSATLESAQLLLARCRHGEAPWQDGLVVADPSVSRAKAFTDAMDELRASYGASFKAIESAVDTRLSSYYGLKKGKQKSGVRSSTARKVLELLAKARKGVAPWQDGEVQEEPAEPAEAAHEPEETEEEATPDAAMVPTNMDEAQKAVFMLGALVDERVRNITDGLKALRDGAPKMMRVAYDAEIDRLRDVANTVADLLDDFES